MRRLLRILMMIIVPSIVAVMVARALNYAFLTPYDEQDSTLRLFEVENGQSFRKIAKNLERKEFVRYWWTLDFLGRIKKGRSVLSGEYELSRNMNPIQILDKLFSGSVYRRRVTIKEGTSMWGIGAIVEEAGLASRADFEKALVDPGILASANVQAASLEGYLFPETYFFSRPINPAQIINALLEESAGNWGDAEARRASELSMSRHEILTIASIIEKESGMVSEQPIIASVIYNRLKAGMKLQLDPTVIYGIPNFNGNLTKADLERPTPYNTYTNYGLPPGPITNPGRSAIQAALFPANTAFLYFVAAGSGSHFFSATLAEHNDAVRRFQLAK